MSGRDIFDPHRYRISVRAQDIDMLGHVNNAVYLTWIQVAVLDHWHSIADIDAVAAFRWFAVSHAITYRRPAFAGDELIATLVLDRVQRESAFYNTEIHRNGVLLAEAHSRWCCVDAVTLRPARVPSSLVTCIGADRRPIPPRTLCV